MAQHRLPLNVVKDENGRVDVKRNRAQLPDGYAIIQGTRIGEICEHFHIPFAEAGFWERVTTRGKPDWAWHGVGWLLPVEHAEEIAALDEDFAKLGGAERLERFLDARVRVEIKLAPKIS